MPDPFLEREKELMKLNESLNTKMIFDLKQPKAVNSKRMKKPIAKSFKYDQINHAKLCTKATSKLKADNCEIIKKPISNAYTTVTATAAAAVVQKFTVVEKKHELDAKDIAFNRNSSNNNNTNRSNADDTHTTCNGGIKQTKMMGDGGGADGGGGGSRGDDDDNKQQISNEHFDHALIETIEKAIDTKVVASSATETAAAHLSLIPSNVYRKNITNDGIIK